MSPTRHFANVISEPNPALISAGLFALVFAAPRVAWGRKNAPGGAREADVVRP
jgi:hypothetical protein